jgi:hypothetical protein
MWAKHIVSILDIVDEFPDKRPSIAILSEKIGDAINYLVLLEAMIVEDIFPKWYGYVESKNGDVFRAGPGNTVYKRSPRTKIQKGR